MTQHHEPCGFCGGQMRDCWRGEVFSSCQKCGFIQRNHLPSQDELDAYYATAWSEPDSHSRGTGRTNADLAAQYSRELLRSLQRSDARGLRLLDFGAGHGALVRALQQAGADVYAVEPYGIKPLLDSGLAAYATVGDLPEGLLFDGVVSMDVVEHLPRPWQEIQQLYGVVKPGGWLCISTPNPAGVRARLGGEKWSEARNPGHICFMDSGTLTSMLKTAGFRGVRPVRWHIRYQQRRVQRRVTQSLLMMLGLHGVTRVLAFR